jgi:hypothetical protein
MARPKSEDKCNAILSAATHIFAERGRGAATAAISSAAGLAEGTLFTYFKTKDELVSALYREIKLELADAMMSGFPRKKASASNCNMSGIAMWTGASRIPSGGRYWHSCRTRLQRNPERRVVRHSSRSKQWRMMRLGSASCAMISRWSLSARCWGAWQRRPWNSSRCTRKWPTSTAPAASKCFGPV